VEPVPEFYGRAARLVQATRDALHEAGALTPPDWQEVAGELDAARKIVQKLRKEKKGLASLSREEQMLLTQFDPLLNDTLKPGAKEKDLEEALSRTSGLLDEYHILGPQALRELMELDLDLGHQWARLAGLCHRLEILAHKQLRQVPFSDEENFFLKTYGQQLAHVMLYGGNSYVRPRDDAPRVVDIFSNPQVGKHLLVGTARPRALWVLYPVKGVEVLCRGAVLPYYEFSHPERLTDTEWKALLDSPRRPEVPAWLRPLIGAEQAVTRPKPK
jgi:hypothetical protein